jgi:GntR family transcriptional regulator, rspAB operon transcriptional repressor
MADDVHSLQPIGAKPEPLVEIVFGIIHDAIVRKDLKPGSRISEARLAAQLNVSKTPVREALLRLEGIGLVVPDGNRGSRVVWPSAENIQHAFEVRALLEGRSASRAAAHAGLSDHVELRRLAEESLKRAEVGDGDGFRRQDQKLHGAIAQASGNDVLKRLVDNAYTLTWALRRRETPSIGYQVGCAQEHLRIVAAITDHDPVRAEAEMTFHLDKSRRFVLEHFSAADQEAETAAQDTGGQQQDTGGRQTETGPHDTGGLEIPR